MIVIPRICARVARYQLLLQLLSISDACSNYFNFLHGSSKSTTLELAPLITDVHTVTKRVAPGFSSLFLSFFLYRGNASFTMLRAFVSAHNLGKIFACLRLCVKRTRIDTVYKFYRMKVDTFASNVYLTGLRYYYFDSSFSQACIAVSECRTFSGFLSRNQRPLAL